MDFATRYNPKDAEDRICKMWEEQGHFTAHSTSAKSPFVIVIPPPNVTGSLHMGHALNNTLQDILIRYKRMQGFEALYLPGTDHAGIATQFVVEKELKKEKRHRFDLGREKFLERVWEWKKKYGDTILYQLRRLGCSCDWTRTRFTMDDGYLQAVKKAFVKLYDSKDEDGNRLIYKGLYTINWCPRCLTALSDIEVEHKEENGKLWYFKYPMKDEKNKFITVATTRPETVLGDTAVAVNPKDARYKDIVGKTVLLPIVEREIPIIADAFVDMEFGTGAVKITPAHDVNDFEASRRHNLPAIAVIDEKGVMNENAGALFKGQDRFEARKNVVAEFIKRGLLDKEVDYQVSLGVCYRCKTIIEPYLSEQWFVKMKPLAQPAIEAVKNGDVKFIPERWAKVYLDWLENTKDWCISRQIWWGHRIPAYYCKCGETIVEEQEPKFCPKCKSTDIRQDEDVLDTWFSSALWPFATMGWPEKTADLEKFYPTQVLVTGRDIIYLWVARMVMMGLKLTGRKPFSSVFINPTIQNPEGRRMSKSLGTGVDPLELIDQFGADATRFGLTAQVTDAQDIKFSPAKLEHSRNFITKLWNASRFVVQNIGSTSPTLPTDETELKFEDKWILSRLNTTIRDYTALLERYEFGAAAQTIYRFIWNEFCDWYIELAKRDLADHTTKQILSYTLNNILLLLHPIAPFVTEEIWQRIEQFREQSLSVMLADWPNADEKYISLGVETSMESVMEIVRGIREVRNRMVISEKTPLSVAIVGESKHHFEGKTFSSGFGWKDIANVDKIIYVSQKPKMSATVVTKNITLYVLLEGKIDVAKELKRQEDTRTKLLEQIKKSEAKLSDKSFRSNAPDEIVEREEEHLRNLKEQLEEVEKAINDIKNF